jgi:hypothetical protein
VANQCRRRVVIFGGLKRPKSDAGEIPDSYQGFFWQNSSMPCIGVLESTRAAQTHLKSLTIVVSREPPQGEPFPLMCCFWQHMLGFWALGGSCSPEAQHGTEVSSC